jgi:hypothetical protein
LFGAAPRPGQRVLTDLAGRFQIDNLAQDETFAVRAEDMHGALASQRGVRSGSEVTLTVPGVGTLRGSVLDGAGHPLASTSIEVNETSSGWSRAVLAKVDGSWELRDVSSGHLQVRARDLSGHVASQELELRPRQTLDQVRLVLGAAAAELPL